MSVSGIQEIVIGVGHLRQQVGFYGSNFGLRVTSKGRVGAELCRDLWGVDDSLDVVTMGRPDLPEESHLRLIRTSDLPARPDFLSQSAGPLGIVFATGDIRRVYYRLSGTGVEFHSSPLEVNPGADSAPGHPRFTCYGRAYDGEYLILIQGAHERPDRGTLSPFFGVTEPLECLFVVTAMDECCRFMTEVLDHRILLRERRSGATREQAMGLPAGTAFDVVLLGPSWGGGAFTTLLDFGQKAESPGVAPPARGISALRFDVDDCEARCRRARALGAEVVSEPRSVDHPALGRGWVASLFAPFGVLIELWQQGG
ncbi:MAG: VOC family protein [Holophagales bacterium]|nr:VOC family protein [Holophagales bacterium]